jgi:hypothetical protein
LEEIKTQLDLDVDGTSWEEFIGASDHWTRLDASLCAISSQKEFRYTCLIHLPHRTNKFEERGSRLLEVIKGGLPLASASPKLSVYYDFLLNK